MKQIIIVFAVLLLLLLIISIFGGSVRSTEGFDDGTGTTMASTPTPPAGLGSAGAAAEPQDVPAKPSRMAISATATPDYMPDYPQDASDASPSPSAAFPEPTYPSSASPAEAEAAGAQQPADQQVEPFTSASHMASF